MTIFFPWSRKEGTWCGSHRFLLWGTWRSRSLRAWLPHFSAALFLGLLVFCTRVKGDQMEELREQADSELTAAYKECLAHFQPNAKEVLRISERAWIVFSDKEEAAAAFTANRRGLNDDDLAHKELNEIRARTNQLRSFFILPDSDLEACQRALQDAEAGLTEAYKRALSTLSLDERRKLRDAQRAWIDFRDKEGQAHFGDPSGRAQIWSAVVLARRRTQELSDFYVSRISGYAGTAPVVAANTPTPPESAELSEKADEFKKRVGDALAVVSSRSSGKMQELTSLSGVGDLPGSVSLQLASLEDKARDYRTQVGYEVASTKSRDELAIADALDTFANVIHGISSGDASSAEGKIAKFLLDFSTAPSDSSKALWAWLESTRTLCARSELEAKGHLDRAQSLSAAGKNGEAIEECKKAYQMFPTPTIAQAIKHLREESLGL